MTIPFNDVSASQRASETFIELAGVRRSLAGLFIPPRGGLVGQYDASKTATVDYVGIKVTSSDDVGLKFGFGSHIHRQALKFPPGVFLQGKGVDAFPLPEEGGGTAATEDITFTGTATSSGTLYFGIGGDLVQVAVASGDAFGVVAASLVTALTAKQNLAVAGVATDGVVAVTAKGKGTYGNQILLKVNPSGEVQENKNPAGITTTISIAGGYMASGETDPSVEDVFLTSGGLDALGTNWYTAFTMPLTDATNIAFYKTSGDLRSDPAMNRMFGAYGGYVVESYAAALALPAVTNSKWIGQIWENRNESPAFELSAQVVGIILDEQNQAPNRPYKTLELDGPVDDSVINRSDLANDALFKAGMSYCKIDASGALRLGDVALTYRTNDAGGATEEWFDAVSLHARQAKAYSIEQLFLADKYTRAVVVDNDAVTAVTYAIAPKDVVADLTKLVLDLWVPNVWTKNADAVIASISAEINAANNGRIDAEITDDEAKALRIIAMRYAYLF